MMKLRRPIALSSVSIFIAGHIATAQTQTGFQEYSQPSSSRQFYEGFARRVNTPLARPTGPFAVGRTDRLLTDTSRNVLYRSVTNGSLMATLWYPAVATQLSAGRYINAQEMAGWIEFCQKKRDRTFEAAQLARLTSSDSFSFPEAGLTLAPRKLPVVIYSHGQLGMRTENTFTAEELASYGFVVVSISHAGTIASRFPDGTLVKSRVCDLTNRLTMEIFKDKVKDLQFVLDDLAQLNEHDRLFARRLDVERIGVYGWSYGGAAAAELCRLDSRCKAGVALDPGGHPDLDRVDLKQPFMIMIGDQGSSYRQLFDRLTKDAYFIQFKAAGHDEFGDLAQFLRPAETGRIQPLIRMYLVAFFERYLKTADNRRFDNSLPDVLELDEYHKK